MFELIDSMYIKLRAIIRHNTAVATQNCIPGGTQSTTGQPTFPSKWVPQ